MKGGFSFCGVDISNLGLEYAPSLDQTYVFSGSEYMVHQESFDAHHGGYFYGTTIQPKTFYLKCYFQDQNISDGLFTKIENFFYRGRTGKLVFKNRDWVWYSATVTNIDFKNISNYKNGFINISLVAFYPFARCDNLFLEDVNVNNSNIINNSGLLEESQTPITSHANITTNSTFLLYNPGTEVAPLSISISGNAGEGVTILNKTTNQECKFINFTSADTSDKSKSIITDSLNGKTIITDGVKTERAFKYHDGGFIKLVPSGNVQRNVTIKGNNTSEIELVDSEIYDDYVKRFIFVNNKWIKIIGMGEPNILILEKNVSLNTTSKTTITNMNEIEVITSHGTNIKQLDFIYKPTFR